MAAIDKNRGVTIRKYAPGDMFVYMYKDEPGVYYNAHGKTISTKIAAAAGFPVDDHLKEKARRDRMSEAKEAIDREMNFSGEKEVILFRRGDYKAIQRPLGKAQVYDDENNLLTPRPIPEQEAKVMLEYLVPGEDTEETAFSQLEQGEPVEPEDDVNVLEVPHASDKKEDPEPKRPPRGSEAAAGKSKGKRDS